MNELYVPLLFQGPIRPIPPACRIPLNREQRVHLLMWRDSEGYLLWNPDDRLDPDAMSGDGFAGQRPAANGTRKADKAAPLMTMEAVAAAIAQRFEERRRGREAA